MTSYGLCLVHWGEPGRVEFYETAGVNTPPVARFTVSPTENLTTFTDVRLDASLSTDTVDTLGAGLSFRWDLDGDGTFDTPFETNAVRTLRPSTKGTWTIGLEVQDQFEARDRTVQTVEVAADTDPGLPGEPHTPWVLDQEILDGVFDGANGWFYASAMRCGLLKVSLATGLAVRRWGFGENRCSGALAWVPDLGRLYVAVKGVGGEDNYVADPPHLRQPTGRPFPDAGGVPAHSHAHQRCVGGGRPGCRRAGGSGGFLLCRLGWPRGRARFHHKSAVPTDTDEFHGVQRRLSGGGGG
jgi:hypothetical protein